MNTSPQMLEQKRIVDPEAVLLARVYALILSWGEAMPEEKASAQQDTRAASVDRKTQRRERDDESQTSLQ
jgi:hypothetical protein